MLTAMFAGVLAQLSFVPAPPEPAHPQPAAGDRVCRRLTLPNWNKPRLVCLTRAQWRELAQGTTLGQQEAMLGRR